MALSLSVSQPAKQPKPLFVLLPLLSVTVLVGSVCLFVRSSVLCYCGRRISFSCCVKVSSSDMLLLLWLLLLLLVLAVGCTTVAPMCVCVLFFVGLFIIRYGWLIGLN